MWKEAYLSNVVSTDPMELVCLLYQHAVNTVQEARRHLANRDVAGRGQAISKTIGMIGELNASLDHNVGSEISTNLERLYSYMMFRLTEANIRQQDAPLAEVESLLMTLRQAWEETRKQQPPAAAQPATPAPAVPVTPAPVWQDQSLEPAAHGWSA